MPPKIALKAALNKRHISARRFSKMIGIQYKNVWRLFHVKNPRFKTLVKWAALIGCRVRDLIKE